MCHLQEEAHYTGRRGRVNNFSKKNQRRRRPGSGPVISPPAISGLDGSCRPPNRGSTDYRYRLFSASGFVDITTSKSYTCDTVLSHSEQHYRPSPHLKVVIVNALLVNANCPLPYQSTSLGGACH